MALVVRPYEVKVFYLVPRLEAAQWPNKLKFGHVIPDSSYAGTYECLDARVEPVPSEGPEARVSAVFRMKQ